MCGVQKPYDEQWITNIKPQFIEQLYTLRKHMIERHGSTHEIESLKKVEVTVKPAISDTCTLLNFKVV